MQQTDALQMFKGAPAHGEYPAEPQTMEMEGMTMQGVKVDMVAKPDSTNNYHFMPHVAWVEPGTKVIWGHADIDGISEPVPHTVTAFGANQYFPRLIPPDAHEFDSGYIAGLHGQKSVEHGIDHRFNQRISDLLVSHGNPLRRGPFTHTFEHEGVYLYYCQNHHGFKMAGAIVVGELWGENGAEAVQDPHGWSPAMTADTEAIERIDEFHGTALHNQVHELREMIHSGGEMMGGH
ncbi:MAG: plastocyanin/azurin family copper-binding protein [Halobacteriaceae archaeon]